MGYHIDFLPIGKKKCGESIAIQLGDLTSTDRSKRSVIIIDGGYTENGQAVVDFVNTHYGTNVVDLVVSTHPDQDHINGLKTVLEQMDVKALWLHQPWRHSQAVSELRTNGFVSATINKKLEKSLSAASQLEDVAKEQGVPIYEPFAGEYYFDQGFGKLHIVGPSREYYEQLLGEILDYVPQERSFLVKAFENVTSVFETHDIETLKEGGDVSPQNNTSTVLMLELDDGRRALFTGDAGSDALGNAHEVLVSQYDHEPGKFILVQVPHHGSRQNVSPSLLDKLLGAKTPVKDMLRGHAYVSISEEECQNGHPKKVATNAFKRRGYPVHATKGKAKSYFSDGFREGWGQSEPLPHYDKVEES